MEQVTLANFKIIIQTIRIFYILVLSVNLFLVEVTTCPNSKN